MDLVLAPVITAGLLHATPRRLIRSWLLVFLIVALIFLVRATATAPWRSFIDSGVMVGLGWGLASIFLWTGTMACTDKIPENDPEWPVGSWLFLERRRRGRSADGVVGEKREIGAADRRMALLERQM